MISDKLSRRKQTQSFFKRRFLILLSGILFSLIFIFGCHDEPGFIGLEILPDNDKPRVNFSRSTILKGFTYSIDSLQSSNYSLQLLGEVNDPVFGHSQPSFFSRMIMSSYGYNFGSNPTLDSVFLYMHLGGIYGNKSSSLEINIFELIDTIYFDSAYYDNFNPSGFYNPANPVATFIYTPGENDTILKIPITNSQFNNRLFEIDSASKANDRNFQKYFLGLYVTAQSLVDPGMILTINLSSFNSRIVLHYHNDKDPTLAFNYFFGSFVPKINLFRHDYSSTVFYPKLNQAAIQDSVIYLQSMGGLSARIQSENLKNWRDSLPVAINRARLILPVEELDLTAGVFSRPVKLVLLRKDVDGKYQVISDNDIGLNYFGGGYNAELKAYTFNITREIQKIANGTSDELNLYLLVNDQITTPNRVVLTSGSHSRPIRLEITYQRF